MYKSKSFQSYKTKSTNQYLCQKQCNKKYKCIGCENKKYHDYNRENRIKKEQNRKRKTSLIHNNIGQENRFNQSNPPQIKQSTQPQKKAIRSLKFNELYKIKQTFSITQRPQQNNQKRCSQSPIKNMKQFHHNLFSTNKQQYKNKQKHIITIKLKEIKYYIQFQNIQKMKIALCQVKQVIKKMENQYN